MPATLAALAAALGIGMPAAIGAEIDLLVGSYRTDSVLRYDGQTGAYIGAFAGAGRLDGPTGLALGPDGNLYVCSYYSSSVLRYDGHSGAFIDVFASGGLYGPRDLLFGPDGNLYVSGGNADAVLRYDGQTGDFIDVFASGDELDGPSDLIFIPEPTALVLLALGGLVVMGRKRQVA